MMESLHGASLLHHAIEAGSIKCTRMLIEKRLIDVNIADESGGATKSSILASVFIDFQRLLSTAQLQKDTLRL